MLEIELFGDLHQFYVLEDRIDLEAAMVLISDLSQKIPSFKTKERAYFSLCLQIALLYLQEKKISQEMSKEVDRIEKICAMIEQSLGKAQTILPLGARSDLDF